MDRGVHAPWRHQVEAAELARGGEHVVVATGTASGKSLAYQLPVLTALLAEDRGRARSTWRRPRRSPATSCARWRPWPARRCAPATYDGDTPTEERDWVRAHARLVLTNPDMLHRGILPGRTSGGPRLLRRLRYVVVDECHAYRGVFGSHVAQVLRRLRRICRRYGADAGVRAGLGHRRRARRRPAPRLVGAPVAAVTDGRLSPRGATTSRCGSHR